MLLIPWKQAPQTTFGRVLGIDLPQGRTGAFASFRKRRRPLDELRQDSWIGNKRVSSRSCWGYSEELWDTRFQTCSVLALVRKRYIGYFSRWDCGFVSWVQGRRGTIHLGLQMENVGQLRQERRKELYVLLISCYPKRLCQKLCVGGYSPSRVTLIRLIFQI